MAAVERSMEAVKNPDGSEEVPTAVVDHSRGRVNRMFRALENRNYRLLWIGMALQSEGQWMEQVARGWLLWELSHDPLMLGLYGSLRTLPMLGLAIPAGILTDRMSRIALIQVAQIAACVMAFAFAGLVHSGVIAVWMVLGFAFLNGSAEALRMPARQSLVATVVPPRELLNAIALNEVAQYTMRIAGPILAGGLMAMFFDPFIGVAAVFYLRGFLYLVAAATTAMMHAPKMSATARDRSVRQNLGDTFTYLRSDPVLLPLAVIGAAPATFGQPYQHLLPIFALSIFDVGPFGLGLMSATVGAGALFGSLGLAALESVRRMGWVLFAALLFYGVAIIAFGLAPWYPLALTLLLILGASQALFNALRQTITQLLVRDEQRGRVIAVTQLTRGGLSPLGSLQAGTLAGIFSAPIAVVVMGTSLATIAILSLLFLRTVRDVEYSASASIHESDASTD